MLKRRRLTIRHYNRHLQPLQESGLVEVWKGIKNNRPQTLCRLTADGRKRFQDYIAVLAERGGFPAHSAFNLLYLDELFTRMTFRLWPPRRQRSASVTPTLRVAETLEAR